MRSVSKKPGPAQIIDGAPGDVASLAAPSTTIGAPRSASAGRADSAADCTPGTAAIRRSSRRRRSRPRPPVAGEAHVGLEHGHAVDGIADAQPLAAAACCRKMLVPPSSSTETAT